ncbi:MAG TPA: DUF4112 domain-containing protein [Bryobacteraceae bacterium]|nr:DUF4112 domain-containing protein [Bryobacteraceae bacterium]
MAEVYPKRNSAAWSGPSGFADDRSRSADEMIERLAWLMDGSIPLPGGYRIGLDPIIGLVPGVGDLIGTLVSSAIVLQAHRAGIAKPTLLRMVANVGIDAVVGAIPFAGDLFDFAFKANRKNLQLYRDARSGAGKPARDAGFLAVLLLALGVIVAMPVLLLIWLGMRLL